MCSPPKAIDEDGGDSSNTNVVELPRSEELPKDDGGALRDLQPRESANDLCLRGLRGLSEAVEKDVDERLDNLQPLSRNVRTMPEHLPHAAIDKRSPLTDHARYKLRGELLVQGVDAILEYRIAVEHRCEERGPPDGGAHDLRRDNQPAFDGHGRMERMYALE